MAKYYSEGAKTLVVEAYKPGITICYWGILFAKMQIKIKNLLNMRRYFLSYGKFCIILRQ